MPHAYLGKIEGAIKAPRAKVSEYAPQMYQMKINPDKIREVIGKGGETIRTLTQETNTEINIDENGVIVIAAQSQESADEARRRIELITAEVEVGAVYEGTVLKILDNNVGAIVSIIPGKDGLVHISQIAHERVKNVSDYLQIGQTVKVKALEVDERGRVRLSIKALIEAPAPQPQPE